MRKKRQNKHLGERIFIKKSEQFGHELWKIDGLSCIVTCCSQCNSKIERKGTDIERPRIYCSNSCLNESQRSGVAKIAKEKYFMETYGVTNPYALPEVREKVKQTCLERYGYENISSHPDVKKKKSECMKELCATTDRIERQKQTCLEKYGHTCYFATEKSREALKQYALDTYGVEHHMKSEVFKQEFKQAYFEKNGVENPLQLASVQEKIRQTCLDKYGVTNVYQRPDLVEKCMQAKINNRSHSTSKVEQDAYEILCQNFGDVEQQKVIFYRESKNTYWVIDFYIPKYDTYVQFDGVYWHGTNHTMEELKEAKKNGDKSAGMQIKAKHRDNFQNAWFNKNNMKLYRIIEGVDKEIWLAELKQIISL